MPTLLPPPTPPRCVRSNPLSADSHTQVSRAETLCAAAAWAPLAGSRPRVREYGALEEACVLDRIAAESAFADVRKAFASQGGSAAAIDPEVAINAVMPALMAALAGAGGPLELVRVVTDGDYLSRALCALYVGDVQKRILSSYVSFPRGSHDTIERELVTARTLQALDAAFLIQKQLKNSLSATSAEVTDLFADGGLNAHRARGLLRRKLEAVVKLERAETLKLFALRTLGTG